MKKLLGVVLTALLVFGGAGVAIAGWGNCHGNTCPGDQTATGFYQTQTPSEDYSSSSTGWHGNYNDNSEAYAYGASGGDVETYANAHGSTRESERVRDWYHKTHRGGHWHYKTIYTEVPNMAYEEGRASSWSMSDTFAWSKDFGTTSMAGADAYFYGTADTHGKAIGEDGCREKVFGTVWVAGTVMQGNDAGETGYSNGQGIAGGNTSMASFYAEDFDFEDGRGYVHDDNWIDGSAFTKGWTEVSIDPYGHRRSFSGYTTNFGEVNVSHGLQDSVVAGSGGISGLVQKAGAFANANAGFSYQGFTNGEGNAQINGAIHVHGSYSEATASGSSYAVGN